MDGKEREEVVRLATMIACGMVLELLEKKPEYMTERLAKRKYKMLLWEWEQRGLVRPFRTENGKHKVYPKHRLVELYEAHIMGWGYK